MGQNIVILFLVKLGKLQAAISWSTSTDSTSLLRYTEGKVKKFK